MINHYRSSVRTPPKRAEAATLVIWGQRDRYLGEELAEPDADDVPSGADPCRAAKPAEAGPKTLGRGSRTLFSVHGSLHLVDQERRR
jgi:pimeloyl-ACP methyl ester carboxylesterase